MIDSRNEHNTDGNPLRHRREKGSMRCPGIGGPNVLYSPAFILCLAALSTILLIAAVIIGVYCGSGSGGLSPSYQNATDLLSELKKLQAKHGELIRATEQAQRALEEKGRSHLQLKQQLDLQKIVNDGLQSQIRGLRLERAKLQSNKSDIQRSCGRCQPEWGLLGSLCYFYSGPLPKMNWHESRADCVRRGADLAVIDSQEKQEILFDFLPVVPASNTPWWATGEGIWIGLSDLRNESTWVWVKNETELQVGFWITDEPNDYGKGEDCAAIFNRGRTYNTWFDAGCDKGSFQWLCEMAPQGL